MTTPLYAQVGLLDSSVAALPRCQVVQGDQQGVDMLQARQLPGIGRLLAQRLKAAGAGTLRQLAALDPRRIETITQRNYPFGAHRKHQCSAMLLLCVQP